MKDRVSRNMELRQCNKPSCLYSYYIVSHVDPNEMDIVSQWDRSIRDGYEPETIIRSRKGLDLFQLNSFRCVKNDDNV